MKHAYQQSFAPAWNNQGLFSRNFLENRLRSQPFWNCDQRAQELLAAIAHIYREEYSPTRQEGNEEDTRNSRGPERLVRTGGRPRAVHSLETLELYKAWLWVDTL